LAEICDGVASCPRSRTCRRSPPRTASYSWTAGYNEVINQRQFGVPGLRWPVEYRYPDRTYRDQLRIDVGGTSFELRDEKGETDDHTVTWVPGSRVLCCGFGRMRQEVYTARAEAATSTMATGVFRRAAQESLDQA
jgi:hypothetical protein